MADDLTLEDLRTRIDEIDSNLLELISERARMATEVARVKSEESDDDCGFYRPEREAQVLRKIIERNPGPLSEEEMARLFREIMSACLALEQTLNIAYLGPEGTFTQAAALKHFGHSVKTTAMGTIDQVFREVESGACQYGVVPVENSIEGVINHTLDMLTGSNLMICGEVELRIHHHLMSKEDSIDNITRVYSHQQSLAQCRAWLDAHLLKVERIAVNSNAEAARIVADEANAAAIASESAAEFYELSVLMKNIENESDNTTRFLVLGQHETLPSDNDKTSLLFTAPNNPGSLQEMLACFSDNGVSLTRIESRPSRKGMWEYVFFVDIEGHVQEATVALALDKLNDRASMVKLLGSYPRAVL
ncbi:MAG: chorismate mutase/prephenate dehydratase [Gammaproteobacteria bacterium]|jgi:chorismate mutase/prephenate dehydratase